MVLPGALPLTGLAVTLSDALTARIVREVRQLQVRDRNRDDLLSLTADQRLMTEVLSQLLADTTAYDLPKAIDVRLDPGHTELPLRTDTTSGATTVP